MSEIKAETMLFSDLTISTPDSSKTYPAHKYILSVRSPVIKKILTANMEEGNYSSVWTISDFPNEVVKGMLEYIYTEKAPVVPPEIKKAADWLRLAETYQLNHYKEEVEKAFCRHINLNNVVEVFRTAQLYKAEILKMEAVGFMKTNYKVVSNSTSLEEFSKNNPDGMMELCRLIWIMEFAGKQ